MVNAKEFFEGNFLKAEACKGGEIVEFLDGGNMEEIINPEGKTKVVLNFEVRVDRAGEIFEKTFTPNKGNGNAFVEAWGDDSEKWIGKKFKVTLTKVLVFGKRKNSIVAEPILDETDKVPVVKP